MKPRRKGASEKIESRSARNVCFSKRRTGLFKKAQQLCNLHPDISVNAIIFSPAGTPFVFGNPSHSSILYRSPLPHHRRKSEIDALLGVDISSLNREELESHRNDLHRLRSILLSKRVDGGDGPSQNERSDFSLRIGDQNLQALWSIDTQNDDTGFSQSFSIEDVDEEIEAMLRDFVTDGDAHCDMDGMSFGASW